MSNAFTSSPASRKYESGQRSGQSSDGRGTGPDAGGKKPHSDYGAQIAQIALQSIGMSTRDPFGPPARFPEYALAVSLIFTKATNQTIMLGTPPKHVLSTSILWASLAHDKRFEQVSVSEAKPGDIIIGSGWQQEAGGYAGVIVDHGRIISNSSQGVRVNSNLLEIQRSHPEMTTFRYVGFWNFYRSKTLANAGFNPSEPRTPAGQPSGGQWTSGMAPSTALLSGRNSTLLPDQFGAQVAGKKVINPPRKPSESSSEASKSETSDTLLAKVLQALKDGGEHPTPDQMEKVGEACDAWQHYAVGHGVPQDVAGALIQNFFHTYLTGRSDSNLEREYDFRQGESAGSEAATIVAGALIAISNIPGNQPFLKVESPAGKFGSGDFGNEIHAKIADGLKAKYPNVSFILRVEPGQTGVDVTVSDKDVPDVGFKYAEIKPNSASGQKTFGAQVQRWKDSGQVPQNGSVQPITYDANGDVHLGFKLNQTTK